MICPFTALPSPFHRFRSHIQFLNFGGLVELSSPLSPSMNLPFQESLLHFDGIDLLTLKSDKKSLIVIFKNWENLLIERN